MSTAAGSQPPATPRDGQGRTGPPAVVLGPPLLPAALCRARSRGLRGGLRAGGGCWLCSALSGRIASPTAEALEGRPLCGAAVTRFVFP